MVTLLLVACLDGPGDPVVLPDADYDAFVDDVHPVLEAGCANPSCHGSASRPFRVFAARRYRLEPAELYRATPLTDEELALDYDCAVTFLMDLESTEDCALLTKPLDPADGGSEHRGGVQFADVEEPGYQVISAWVDDALARGTP